MGRVPARKAGNRGFEGSSVYLTDLNAFPLHCLEYMF